MNTKSCSSIYLTIFMHWQLHIPSHKVNHHHHVSIYSIQASKERTAAAEVSSDLVYRNNKETTLHRIHVKNTKWEHEKILSMSHSFFWKFVRSFSCLYYYINRHDTVYLSILSVFFLAGTVVHYIYFTSCFLWYITKFMKGEGKERIHKS